ncbi:MAG: NEW3 domain-containing protein [Mycobacterium sp.]
MTARFEVDRPPAVEAEAEAEATLPLYARYWLHNRGPAPLGGLAAVAHVHPQRVAAVAGTEVTVRLTVASDCTDAQLAGTVSVVCPPGWTAVPAAVPVALAPGEHLAVDVVLRVPPETGPGCYPVRAQLQLTGDNLPPSWRQPVEDVCLVSVGAADSRLLYLVDGPADVVVTTGGSVRLCATVGTDACADLAVEAHLVSPWGTWEWIGPAAQGAVLPAGGSVELGFDVAPPVWTEPGTWWALIRAGCAGSLVYSPAVRVTVR